MSNLQKIEIVDKLAHKMDSSSGIYITKYTGLNVVGATRLRKQFRDNDVDYFVSKNTLTKIAASKAGLDNKLDDFLVGQVGIAYAGEDPTSPARVIKDFNKDNKNKLEVLGLVFEGKVFSAEKYKELADLPARDVLISMFVGGLNSPMVKLLGTLNGAMAKLVGTLNGLKQSKS